MPLLCSHKAILIGILFLMLSAGRAAAQFVSVDRMGSCDEDSLLKGLEDFIIPWSFLHPIDRFASYAYSGSRQVLCSANLSRGGYRHWQCCVYPGNIKCRYMSNCCVDAKHLTSMCFYAAVCFALYCILR